MYVEETEGERLLSKDKLIDTICNAIDDFNKHCEDNEEFQKGYRYAIYKVSNLLEQRDKEIKRLKLVINAINKYCEEHEDYEYGSLIEQLYKADIEWLENVVRK